MAPLSTSCESMNALVMTWVDDGQVPDVGPGPQVLFRENPFQNTMLITLGGLSVADTPFYDNPPPEGYFMDGGLDSFFMDWIFIEINGVSGLEWDFFADGDRSLGDPNVAIEFVDYRYSKTRIYYAHLDFPVVTPPLAGDVNGDGDVDGLDLAQYAGGGDLAAIAGNFGIL